MGCVVPEARVHRRRVPHLRVCASAHGRRRTVVKNAAVSMVPVSGRPCFGFLAVSLSSTQERNAHRVLILLEVLLPGALLHHSVCSLSELFSLE